MQFLLTSSELCTAKNPKHGPVSVSAFVCWAVMGGSVLVIRYSIQYYRLAEMNLLIPFLIYCHDGEDLNLILLFLIIMKDPSS